MKHNVAAFSLIVDGKEYADAIEPRLISLTLGEKREGGADDLEITLSNHDGQLAPIKRGVYIALKLGWKDGPDVTPGLVDKGRFLVDQIEKSGPPDTLRITARSADLTKRIAKRRDKGWKGKTLGSIVSEVARANGLTPKVHASLAGIQIKSIEQAAKSDMAFIRDLGKRYDAIATVKDGKLLFMPIGTETTASGKAIPGLTLARRENSRFTFTIADREDHDGVEATWHDRGATRKRTVKVGGAKNPKRIKRSFATEAEAKAAARAEASRAKRGQYTFRYDMALGDAACTPNRKVKLSGFDSEIDGIRWLIVQVNHTLDGSGFRTSLEMESAS